MLHDIVQGGIDLWQLGVESIVVAFFGAILLLIVGSLLLNMYRVARFVVTGEEVTDENERNLGLAGWGLVALFVLPVLVGLIADLIAGVVL